MSMNKTPPNKRKYSTGHSGLASTAAHTLQMNLHVKQKPNRLSKEIGSMHKTTGNLFRKKIQDLLEAPASSFQKTASSFQKTSETIFKVPLKTEEDIQLQQTLDQMKQDKLYHSLVKNRIRRRFFERRESQQASKELTQNPEQTYATIQNKDLPASSKYLYLDITGTFYSRSRKRVYDSVYQQNTKKGFVYQPDPERHSVSFLMYTNDKKHKDQLREKRRCKTTASSCLQTNKDEILKISKAGSKQYRLLHEYLEEALHDS